MCQRCCGYERADRDYADISHRQALGRPFVVVAGSRATIPYGRELPDQTFRLQGVSGLYQQVEAFCQRSCACPSVAGDVRRE